MGGCLPEKDNFCVLQRVNAPLPDPACDAVDFVLVHSATITILQASSVVNSFLAVKK